MRRASRILAQLQLGLDEVRGCHTAVRHHRQGRLGHIRNGTGHAVIRIGGQCHDAHIHLRIHILVIGGGDVRSPVHRFDAQRGLSPLAAPNALALAQARVTASR